MDAVDMCNKDNEAMMTTWQKERLNNNATDVEHVKPRHCLHCDCIIPVKRLLAVPNTKYCVNCQRKIEENAR